jgi:hypothetical protein
MSETENPVTPSDTDVEGHAFRHGYTEESTPERDDVEGHARARFDDADDVEGHAIKGH